MTKPILRLYEQEASPVLAACMRKDRCINATRVTIEVLAAFGVLAQPLAVDMRMMNKKWMALMQKKGSPASPEETASWVAQGGWALGIDMRESMWDQNMYAGHLVAIAQNCIVDAAASQFDRPQYDLPMPEIFIGELQSRRFMKGKGPAVYMSELGATISYWKRADDDGMWRIASGWSLNGNGNAEAINIIVHAMRTKLASPIKKKA